MEITKSLFRKIIILYVILSFCIYFINDFLNTYQLDDVLFNGYYQYLMDENIFIGISVCVIILQLLSIPLIYFFKSIGRSLNSLSILFKYIIIMLMGDDVSISLVFPLEIFISFLEIFILYLMFLTPLKLEFANKSIKT